MKDLSFSKVTNLQCSDCNLTVKTAYRRLLQEEIVVKLQTFGRNIITFM